MLIKTNLIILPRRKNTRKKMQECPVLYDERMKCFWKKDVQQNVSKQIAENVDFVENSNLTEKVHKQLSTV